MRLTNKTIGEVADVIAGQSPPSDLYNKTGEGLPFYQGKTDFGEKYPEAKTWCTGAKNKEAIQNDILLSVRAPVGPVNICQVRSVIGRGLSAIRAKRGISFEYLYYYLKTHEQDIAKHGTGSTFKAITQTHINRIKLPIPDSYDDQIRIATVLTRAEWLIAKRKESIKALDELLKSTFLEMFGDPGRNEKGWEKATIRDLITEAKYGTSKSAEGGPYKYLRMNNITTEGYWDFSNLKYIEIEDSEKSKYTLKKNDIVFNRTNSKELVGKTAVYNRDEEVIIAGYLIRVRTKPDVNPWYIWGYLNSKAGKLRLFNLCRNIVGMANINAQELQNIPILKPPFELQNQFAAIVEKVESIKAKQTQNLAELENLYDSLSQRAFKGELDLSGVGVERSLT